ncbi:MAG: thymidylate synthase, partial [Woeseiaceae bacterium]|nr:thymidylate synthase [Woeseiaceae bacterium]
MPNVLSGHEEFTANERLTLTPYFTNLDSPVFAITNLPEVVKGALFARYSRSAKSLRRLFLDEFSSDMAAAAVTTSEVGVERAEKLYTRVFSDYGDDSVAQLGGAHIACEGASNILTKILERGRLMSYLEQSTRYVPYTDQSNGRWKYLIPEEIKDPVLWKHYTETLDAAFATYAHWLEPMQAHYRKQFPKATSDSDGVYRAAIRAKALDTLRGLLP